MQIRGRGVDLITALPLPVLRTVPDMQDFGNVIHEKPVGDDIAADNKLARVFHFVRSVEIGESLEPGDLVNYRLSHGASRFRIVFTDAVYLRFEFVGGSVVHRIEVTT
jgi:hypothetical protein